MKTINFFGTDGIRGKVGKGFFVLDQLAIIGQAIAIHMLERTTLSKTSRTESNAETGESPSNAKIPRIEILRTEIVRIEMPRIVIMSDTRVSCDFIKSALISGLLMHPVAVFDAGILPTPAASHFLSSTECPYENSHRNIPESTSSFDCALIISASHNPWDDNGIKIIDKTGKLSLENEIAISQLIAALQKNNLTSEEHANEYRKLGSAFTFGDAQNHYIQKVIAHFAPYFLKEQKIVLDTANGATALVAPAIFSALGAEIITLNDMPNGFNINEKCGSLYPEILAHAVVQHGALMGFAFDGDGDRVIAVNKFGEIKDGDDIIALLSTHHPTYRHQKIIVGTILTNLGLEHFLHAAGKTLIRVAVGDKHIIERLDRENAFLGGEQAGHVILKDLLATGDGILVALRVAETLISSGNDTMQTYTKFPQIHVEIPLLIEKELCQQAIEQMADIAQKNITQGRIVVRFSGTQPILRIMAEAPSREYASATVDALSNTIQQTLKDLYVKHTIVS